LCGVCLQIGQRWLALHQLIFRCVIPAERPPLTISFQATRAILLANATATSLAGLRLRRSSNQGGEYPRPFSACWITAVAPATSTLRNVSSPARLITPSRVLPAVE